MYSQNFPSVRYRCSHIVILFYFFFDGLGNDVFPRRSINIGAKLHQSQAQSELVTNMLHSNQLNTKSNF